MEYQVYRLKKEQRQFKNKEFSVGDVVERPTVVLRVAGSSPALNKYLYGLQVQLFRAWLFVYVIFDVSERTHDTEVIRRARNGLKKKKSKKINGLEVRSVQQ